MLDLVIRGGRVVDGSGSEARAVDVGVRDGKVVALEKITETARPRDVRRRSRCGTRLYRPAHAP